MISFIHCADLHLDRPFQVPDKLHKDIEDKLLNAAYQSFETLCTEAIDRNVDFLLISGDLYHHEKRSIHAQWFVKKQMERLQRSNIRAYIIHGNHDPVLKSSALVPMPENVYIFPVEGSTVIHETENEKVCLYGFSYPSSAFADSPMPMYQKESADVHIALLHGQEAAETGHDAYAPFHLQELQEKNMDYWALGHIHQRKELTMTPPVIYPGNIQGTNRKEQGVKGGYFVKLKQGALHELEFLPASNVEWKRVQISIKEVESIDMLIEEVFAKCAAENNYLIYTVELIGSGPLHSTLYQRKHEIETLMQDEVEREQISIESLELSTSPLLEQVDSELARDIEKAASDLLNDTDTHVQRLSSLMGHSSIQRHLDPIDKEELEEIVHQARTELLLAIQEEES